MFFIEIENLYELEKAHEWERAITLLRNKWQKDKNNVDVLLRLATECWYIMSNWDFLNLDNTGLSFEQTQKILIQTYNHFIAYDLENNKCKAIFGYMVSLFPNYFYNDVDKSGKLFLQYSKKGEDLLKLAHINEPENKLYKTLYLGVINKSTKDVYNSKQELDGIVQYLFPKNTEIEAYFKEILAK